MIQTMFGEDLTEVFALSAYSDGTARITLMGEEGAVSWKESKAGEYEIVPPESGSDDAGSMKAKLEGEKLIVSLKEVYQSNGADQSMEMIFTMKSSLLVMVFACSFTSHIAADTSMERSIIAPPAESITTPEKSEVRSRSMKPEYKRLSLCSRTDPCIPRYSVAALERNTVMMIALTDPSIAENALLFTPEINRRVKNVITIRTKELTMSGLYPFNVKGIRIFQIRRNANTKERIVLTPLSFEKAIRAAIRMIARTISLLNL